MYLLWLNDTNGDFVADSSQTFDLRRDFMLPSLRRVVSGTSNDGREFVVVCSSGFFDDENPDNPDNEPSPGILLFVRNPATAVLTIHSTKTLVQIGDNRLFNANALALMPNNDLLIADFESDELRIVRDTNRDGMPDTLDDTPYYSYKFFR